MTNRLVHENSPYLLQHANNPVDWYSWGPEALERARAEDKPIFLSIGYMACHWCHVMEHESFEDQVTATLMNEHFISIKVDREERPDLDGIYMSATVAMTGSGGWPMSVFINPFDLRPFYAGTYFPPTPRFNMPSFRDLLSSIARVWQHDRAEILRVGGQVANHIQRASQVGADSSFPLTHSLLDNAADYLHKTYDWGFGGWGNAPKFPQPMTIEFLLQRASLVLPDDDPQKRHGYGDAARHALFAMAKGGMYDVVGGGFSRYSVDNLWRVPHFEKMLTDNAQLALEYLHAYLQTGETRFRQVCEETLDFIRREMTSPDGGFYSSLDADSEGEEGRFYVWQYAEIEQILGAEFDFFRSAYGLSPSGNWEGKIVLQQALDPVSLAARHKITLEQALSRLANAHARLFNVRSQRVRPATDDKILAAWNAMALQAFAEAGRYLRRSDYIETAVSNARFLLTNLYVEGRLLRSWRAGTARHNAYLEDYASLCLALVALYQSDPDLAWYQRALALADEMVTHFADPNGGFFDTRADHETLLMRPRDTQDNAVPSGNSVAAVALLQLAAYGDRPEWRQQAEAMLPSIIETAVQYPTAFAKWLQAADFALGPIQEVAIIGGPEDAGTRALTQTLWDHYRSRQVVAISAYPVPEGVPALLQDRPPLGGKPTAYVCHDFVCNQPVISPEKLAGQL